MKNKKLIFITLCITLIAMLILPGCSSKTDAPASNENNGTASGENLEKFTINFGHGGSEVTAQQVGALAMKEYMEKESNGRFTVNVYPSNQIGNDRELVESVQSGTLEMCLANSVQANFINDAIVYDLYFNFQTLDDAINKFRNDKEFFNTMSVKYDEVGFHLAGFSVHGFREITSNKPIRVPADLGGLTFRTQENKYHIAGFQAMGATPTPFAFNELYTALQQGTVDAQENPIELIYSQKFYEQQDYITMSNHQQQVQTWLVNKDLYNSFPDDLKLIFDEGVKVGCDAA
ncbi:MAG: TRAP transporter substrate-binding protein [Sedimentibacter sp.]